MIRALVAEDSPTARALLVHLLRADPELSVVGEAQTGLEAVELARKLRPDVVIMDVCLPGIDGFEATKRIMFEAPTPVVIVSATVVTSEVSVSLDALRAGALAVMSKPKGPAAPDFADDARRFVRMVKSMSQVKVVRRWPDRPPPPSAPAPLRAHPTRSRIIAIAASTGGPAALHRIFAELPQGFSTPILVVQHMSAGFTEGLARWLDAGCKLSVKLAEDGEPLAAGKVYVAPHDRHLGVSPTRALVSLSSNDPIEGFRPSATHLFDSVARAFGNTALAIMLTGMGRDGVEGLRAVQRVGGCVVAQDEASSVIYGMPGAAVAAGLCDLVLPIDVIAAHILEAVA
jgi:two-component system chemotaxis response regulator CheB